MSVVYLDEKVVLCIQDNFKTKGVFFSPSSTVTFGLSVQVYLTWLGVTALIIQWGIMFC